MKPSLWLAIFASGILFTSVHAAPHEAHGTAFTGNDIQKMTYEVYAGGINAVTAELGVSLKQEDRYSLALEAETKGFLGKIVPWTGLFETYGWLLDDGSELPELHRSTAIFRGEKDLKEYRYNRDGSFESFKIIEAGQDKTPSSLNPDLVQGTTDALTATLTVMENIMTEGNCEGSSEVFDGKRRFELIFNHQADVVISPTNYNIYKGPAVQCSVEVKPLAGKWHEKPRGWMSIQEQGRDKGTLPTVWLASLDEDGPAVPVKVRVKTNYGTLFMHLVSYENEDGTQLTLK